MPLRKKAAACGCWAAGSGQRLCKEPPAPDLSAEARTHTQLPTLPVLPLQTCPQTDNETRALCRQLVQSGKLAAVQKALNNRIGSSYSGGC